VSELISISERRDQSHALNRVRRLYADLVARCDAETWSRSRPEARSRRCRVYEEDKKLPGDVEGDASATPRKRARQDEARRIDVGARQPIRLKLIFFVCLKREFNVTCA